MFLSLQTDNQEPSIDEWEMSQVWLFECLVPANEPGLDIVKVFSMKIKYYT
jgi:hypothetical protein